MTSKKEVLNIPAIQDNIRKRHKEFIKEYLGAIQKVVADHRLFADVLLAKLHRVLVVFKEEGIVDNIKMTEQGAYKTVELTKSGYDTYVVVETNGLQMSIKGYTYTNEFTSDFMLSKKKIMDVSDDKFDWVSFSDFLLSFIHNTIYERKEAAEQRLKSMLEDDVPQEEIVRIIKKK